MAKKSKNEGGTAVKSKPDAHDAESLEEIRKLLTQIEKAEERVQTAEIDLNARKEEAKTAKGVWLTAVSELRKLVQTRKRWREEAKRQPLLNGRKKAAGETPKPVDPLPEGVTATKLIGPLEDFATGSGAVIAKKGEIVVGYVAADGSLFILESDGARFTPTAGKYAEIAEDKSDQPLLEAADKGNGTPEAWRNHKLLVLKGKLTEKQFDALDGTGLKTLGELQQKMNDHGTWWNREVGLHGRHKTSVEDAFNSYLISQQ